VSRKTKIALPPGTELDFNNEDHYRHIMDEAYEGSDPRPYRPTRTPPERSRFWWFWRFFGFWIRVPARRLWNRFSHWDLVEGGHCSGWRARYRLYPKVKDWLEKARGTRYRRLVAWLTESNFRCPTCGHRDFHEEITVYDCPDGRTINMFEHVDGGGLDYWGEAEDARGWLWCYRCGDVSWESI